MCVKLYVGTFNKYIEHIKLYLKAEKGRALYIKTRVHLRYLAVSKKYVQLKNKFNVEPPGRALHTK